MRTPSPGRSRAVLLSPPSQAARYQLLADCSCRCHARPDLRYGVQRDACDRHRVGAVRAVVGAVSTAVCVHGADLSQTALGRHLPPVPVEPQREQQPCDHRHHGQQPPEVPHRLDRVVVPVRRARSHLSRPARSARRTSRRLRRSRWLGRPHLWSCSPSVTPQRGDRPEGQARKPRARRAAAAISGSFRMPRSLPYEAGARGGRAPSSVHSPASYRSARSRSGHTTRLRGFEREGVCLLCFLLCCGCSP